MLEHVLMLPAASAILLSGAAVDDRPLLRSAGLVPEHVLAAIAAEQRRSPSIRDRMLVQVDAKVLRSLRSAAPSVTIEVFGGRRRLTVQSVVRSGEHWRLTGELDGEGGQVHLAWGSGGALAGHAELPDETWTIRACSPQGPHVLFRHDPAKLPSRCGTTTGVTGGASAGPTVLPRPVDVLVVYTPLAKKNQGGKAAIEAELHLRFWLANEANIVSHVPWRWRLVRTHETNFVEPNPVRLVPILRAITNPNDSVMDEVHAVRDRYGADVVALVCDGANRDWGGYAWCRSSRTNAFSVTHREGLVSHLLHHEMGHNLGLAHNRANVDCNGSYSYSYGWRTHDNVWHTVMAYAGGKPPSRRLNVWSSPNVLIPDYTMGTPNDDNARTLVNRGPTVSGFLPTRVYEWERLDGGIPGHLGVPTLVGSGTVHTDEPPRLGFDKVAASAAGALVIGSRTVNLPFLGGTLVPFPDALIVTTGSQVFDARFLQRLPARTPVWFQAFFVDPKAAQGLSATDAVKTQVL